MSGIFLNRDPIGEQGGLNLYAFVGNDPVNDSDLHGLASAAELFAVGRTLVRYGNNSWILRRLGIANIIIGAGECLLGLRDLFSDPPECVASELEQGRWQADCRNNVSQTIRGCTTSVGAAIGAVGGYPGAVIGSFIGRILGTVAAAASSPSVLDSIGGCDKLPEIDSCCKHS